jgi:hypothetical protein
MINSQSKLANRKKKKEGTSITNVGRNKDTTYNLNSKTFRMTENDIKNLKKLTTRLSTPSKPVTGAKVIRALINYAYENEDLDFKSYLSQ